MQQRAIAPLANSFDLLVEGSTQVDHEATLVQRLAVFLEKNGAASRRQDDRALACHILQNLALALSEASLTFTREDVRDVDTGTGLDFGIAVAKRRAQQPCQMLADCGLARAHGAHQ